MLSAYVPCFNNAATLRRAVESVLRQTTAVDEIVVVDDGSTDESTARVADLPVRVVRHERNQGRGAARARAMREARGDLVLCVDAIDEIPPDFVANALPWFAEPKVAAVCGRISQHAPRTAVERWRGRHLFKLDQPVATNRRGALSSGAMIVRAASVAGVGGFSANLREGEDVELGRRLVAAGHEVVTDPRLEFFALSSDTAARVLERYWRWNVGPAKSISPAAYARAVWYSWRVMARADLARGDFPAAAISVACPHYCFIRTLLSARVDGTAEN